MTRQFAALIISIILFAPPLLPQELPCSDVPIPCAKLKLREVEYQVLMNLEKDNAHAMQLNNPSFFQDIYSDDFSGVTWYGLPINKSQLIRLIETSGQNYRTVVESNIQVRIFQDTASVLSLRSEHGNIRGKEFFRQFRVLRVYLYADGGWKVVSQIETQLPSTISR
jgi:Domain of unknown function (DUF4440)